MREKEYANKKEAIERGGGGATAGGGGGGGGGGTGMGGGADERTKPGRGRGWGRGVAGREGSNGRHLVGVPVVGGGGR